ncbi:FAD/FMN-containing dehydrogenase [Azotobacter armeniacus]
MRFFAGIVLCLAPLWALALEVGERLAPWTLLDQHEQAYSLSGETRILLVARSMDGARLVKAALKARPQGYLEARQVVFVADISRMPSLIASLFAVPAMRDYSYRVLLDRDARIVSRYPGDPDKVLWLGLEQGRLRARREFDDASALSAAIERTAP